MADRTLEVALRLRAEGAQAGKVVGDVDKKVAALGDTAKRTSEELAKVDVSQAAAENARAFDQVTAAAFAQQRAVTGQIKSISELQERLSGGARSARELADSEQMLDRAMAQGLLTSEEQADAIKALDRQEKELVATHAKEERQLRSLIKAYDPADAALRKITADEAKLKKAVDEGRISREQYNRAMVGLQANRAQWEQVNEGIEQNVRSMDRLKLSAREVRSSLATAASQLAQGNVAGAGNALLTLGSRGAISFGALGVAIGGVVGLLGAFSVATLQGYRDNQQLERSLIASGNASGTYAGHLAEVRNRVGAAAGAFGDAQTAVAALAASGDVSSESLERAASAALNLSELTGRSIEDTTEQIIRLAKAPSATLAELNEQYNFLTAEVYDHVKALEDQGSATAAAEAAIEAFASVHEQRVEEARQKAGSLEKAWRSVKGTILEAWQAIKDIGRSDIDAQINNLTKEFETQTRLAENGLTAGTRANAERRKKEIYDQIMAKREERDAIEDVAKAAAEEQEIQNKGVAARVAIDKQLDAGLDKKAKKQKALNELIEQYNVLSVANPNDPRLFDGSYERIRQSIEERFKPDQAPKPKKTDAERTEESAKRELANLQQQIALLGELEEGERKASEAARINYETTEGAYKNASEATKQALTDQAQLLDHERTKVEVAKQLVDVQLQIARLQGRGDQAELAKTVEELGRLEQKLLNLGKVGDAADVRKLMNLEGARSEMNALARDIDTFFNGISNAEQRVNIDRENGLISSVTAQQRILDLRQQEIAYLQQQIPLLERQNALLGDPQVAANIEQMKLQLYDLQQQGSLLQTTFQNTFEGGLANALTNLATGTATLKDALLGLVSDVAAGMARLAAQQLASMATAKLMSLLFKGKGESTDVGDGAAKLQTAALATGLAGGAVKFGADALSDAAKELATAATLMIVANSMGGGFAEGGYTGPGGRLQFAGWVHKGEGVLNQDEIRALGGPGGFYALRDAIASGDLARYADVQAPAAVASPRFSFADGGYASAAMGSPQVNLRSIVALDTQDIADLIISSGQFEQGVLTVINRNGSTVRASVNN